MPRSGCSLGSTTRRLRSVPEQHQQQEQRTPKAKLRPAHAESTLPATVFHVATYKPGRKAPISYDADAPAGSQKNRLVWTIRRREIAAACSRPFEIQTCCINRFATITLRRGCRFHLTNHHATVHRRDHYPSPGGCIICETGKKHSGSKCAGGARARSYSQNAIYTKRTNPIGGST